jgi:type IV pilus assembly protein PilM
MKSTAARILSETRRARAHRLAPRWIGLDIGARSIKLAELERTPAGIRLVKSLIQELPSPHEGRTVDSTGWLQTALKAFHADEVHVAASGPEVAMRRVAVPLMSKQEMPEAVKWQAKEHLPFPIQGAVLDFQVTGEVWEKDIKKQDVLVAAAGRGVIQSLMESVARAGARVVSIVPTHAALWAAAAALVPDIAKGSVALVEVGAGHTRVTIAKDGHIRLIRDLDVGSDSLTEAMVGMVAAEHGQMSIDRARAESLKRRYGILPDATDGSTEEGVPLFHLSSLMRPVLEHLLTELSRLFSYYRVQMDEAGVSRLLLCGGGAALKDLQPYLADGLGMTVEVFNPLVRIPERAVTLEPELVAEGGPRLGIAIGLALEHGQGLNLVPGETRRMKAAEAHRGAWQKAAQWALAAAAALYLALHALAFWTGSRLEAQRDRWAALSPAYEQSLRLAASAAGLESTVRQVQRLLDRQPAWDGILRELGALVPPTIELNDVAFSAAGPPGREAFAVRLRGTGSATAVAGEGSIAQFMEALEQSPFFSGVDLVSSAINQADGSRVIVEIRARIE